MCNKSNCLKTLFKKDGENERKYCENCKEFCDKPLRRDIVEMQLADSSAQVLVTYFAPLNHKLAYLPDDEYVFRIKAALSNVILF